MIVLTLSLVVALLLSGCATSRGGDEVPQPGADLDIAALLAETTDFQREILEDGVVTAAEYERALLARRQCVIEAGGVPSELYPIGNNETTFDYDVSAGSDEDRERIQRNADECLPEFSSEVGKVWAFQELLSPTEREAQRPAVITCLQDAGFDIASDADLNEIANSVAASDDPLRVAPCVESFPGFFAVAPAASTGGETRGGGH